MYNSDLDFLDVIIMDSASTKHLFGNPVLVHDVKEINGIRIKGVNSDSLICKKSGVNNTFGDVLFSESIKFNLLSLSKLTVDGFVVEYDHLNHSFIVKNENVGMIPMLFKLSTCGLYVFHLNEWKETILISYINSKNRKRVDQVVELHKCLGHIGWEQLKAGLSGGIISHLQPSDVDNWCNMGIKCNGCVLTKTQDDASVSSNNPDSAIIGEVLHCDILYENSLNYLVCVEESCNFVSVKLLKKMDALCIGDALLEIKKWYKQYNHIVKKVFSDQGSNLSAAIKCSELGISHYTSGVNRHSKQTEIIIKNIRKIMRGMLIDIKFQP